MHKSSKRRMHGEKLWPRTGSFQNILTSFHFCCSWHVVWRGISGLLLVHRSMLSEPRCWTHFFEGIFISCLAVFIQCVLIIFISRPPTLLRFPRPFPAHPNLYPFPFLTHQDACVLPMKCGFLLKWVLIYQGLHPLRKRTLLPAADCWQ